MNIPAVRFMAQALKIVSTADPEPVGGVIMNNSDRNNPSCVMSTKSMRHGVARIAQQCVDDAFGIM